jgi:predicted dehydrogenase
VIGAGQIAAEHLRCLAGVPQAEVVAVCDLSPALAEIAADRFGVPRWYTDHAELLAKECPDVVHVTTPPDSHFGISRDALVAGAHVLLEKPAAPSLEEVLELLDLAGRADRFLIEDYSYVMSPQAEEISRRIASGALGEVVHLDVAMALDIASPGGDFTDANLPHPALSLPGGAIADFLTHLASLAVWFAGPHRSVATAWSSRASASTLPFDDLRALVVCDRASATLGFSGVTQPDGFWLRVEGTRMRVAANLFETRLTSERVRNGPRPLQGLVNGVAEGVATATAAVGSLARKLEGGPGSYAGLWRLVGATYEALAAGRPPPVDHACVESVNRLVAAIANEAAQL